MTHKTGLFCCVIWVYSIETRHCVELFRQTFAFRCPFCCFFLIIPASYFQTEKHRICTGKHAITLSLSIHALFIGICALFPYFSGIVRPVSLHKSRINLYVLNNTTVTPFFACLAIPSACPAIPPPPVAICAALCPSVAICRQPAEDQPPSQPSVCPCGLSCDPFSLSGDPSAPCGDLCRPVSVCGDL